MQQRRTDVGMRRYQLPGYELRLLGELQRQQHSTLFCDLMLQTEGVSVPTHSCILAALSPYLSQKLSASPSPPVGQQRQLQLQAVKAQTLLKLVGLLYSGELEVKGSIEQKDVLAAARQLGLRDLVEGWRDRWREGEVEEEQQSCRRCRENGMLTEEWSERDNRRKKDVHVQTGKQGRRDTDTQVEERRCVSMGTQTVTADGRAMGSSFILPGQTTQTAPAVAQSWDNTAFSLKPQNITLSQIISPTPCPANPSISGTSSSFHSGCLLKTWDVKAAPLMIHRSADSVTDLTSSSVRPQEDCTHQQSSMLGNSMNVLTGERTGVEDGTTDGKMDEKRDKREQQTHAKRDEAQAEMRIVSGSIGMKSLAKIKQVQMAETTQISIKVKLRRTTGELWKVVSMEDTDERFSLVNRQSVLAALKQDIHISKPKTPIPQPVVPTTPKPPPHTNNTSDPHSPSSGLCTPNPDNDPQSAPLPQPQGPVEESDEQIEKLLEDIMIGLNLLPSMTLERDCNSSRHLQPCHDGPPATCHIPAVDDEASQTHATAGAADYVCCHGYGTGSGDRSTDTVFHSINTSHFVTATTTSCTVTVEPYSDPSPQSKCPRSYLPSCHTSTLHHPHPNPNLPNCGNSNWIDRDLTMCCAGIHCSPRAQDQSKYISSSSVQPTAMPIRQHEHTPECHSSRYTRQKDGMSCQGMPLSKTQDCLYFEAARTSVTPMVYYSSGQEPHYPACQQSSSEEERCFPELSPQPQGNEAQSGSFSSGSFPCMEDLHLPRCLSPLQPCSLEEKYQPVLNYSTNDKGDKVQPPLKEQSWLMANPGALQFPLISMGHREGTCPSLLQDTNYCCQSKQCQEHLECSADTALMNPHNEASFTGSCTENEVEERKKIFAGGQNVIERKSNKVKPCLKPKRDCTRDTLAPTGGKTKCINHTRDALGSFLGYKEAKVSDRTKSQINLSFCSVSLSHNNVLAKEREIATSSWNMPSKFAGKPNKRSAITESLREGARSPGALTKSMVVNADQTRIRTRGSLKKTQEGTPNDTSPSDISPEIPMAKRVEIVNKAEAPKRKRGRPCKIKVEDVTFPVRGKKEVQEKEGKPKRKYRKRMRDRNTEGEVLPKNMMQDTLNSGQTLALLGISAQSRKESYIISEELCSQQHNGACSPGDTSAVKPNKDWKQTLGPENADRTKADTDTMVTPADKSRATKQTPIVTLKEFQNLIKRRHLKTRKSNDNKDKKKSCETVKNVQSEGKACKKTDGSYEELTKDTEMDVHVTQTQDRGGIKTSDVILGFAFDKNQNKMITDENHRSQKDAQNMQGKSEEGPYRHVNERKEHSSTGEALVNTLSSDGRFPRLEGIEDSQLTGKDNRHEGCMGAKANKSAEMAPIRATVELEDVGPQELNRSVNGQMDVKVDFSTEKIAFVDEDHPVSSFAATWELGKKNEEDNNPDVGEEEVAKMAIDRGGEREHPLKNPNKAVDIPTSTRVSNTQQSAVTAEGFSDRDKNGVTVPQENNLTTDHDLIPRTLQRTQPLLDLGRVRLGSSGDQEDEEDMEVDILVCSPVKGLQTTECGVGLNIIEITPEEEDEEEEMNDIDVTGD